MTSPGSLPRYLQISELLARDIAAGRLIDGERLPPERAMAGELGIAVGPLRQALAELTERGLLERVQGSGNYVRARADPTSVYAMFRLELTEGGGLPTARILSVDRLPKDRRLPPFGTSADGHRIRRLRLVSGRLAAVEEIWLDASFAPTLTREALSESLYLHYRQRFGLWIVRAEDRIGQSALPDWAPAEFPHRPGAILPEITRIGWSQNGESAEASFTWYDPGTVRYVARLK